MEFDAWRRVLAVNLEGAFLTLRCAMRLMSTQRASLMASSASAVKAVPGVAAYGASKAGLTQRMRIAAKECAPRRIRVNAALPGEVETPMWSEMPFFADLARTAPNAPLSMRSQPRARRWGVMRRPTTSPRRSPSSAARPPPPSPAQRSWPIAATRSDRIPPRESREAPRGTSQTADASPAPP